MARNIEREEDFKRGLSFEKKPSSQQILPQQQSFPEPQNNLEDFGGDSIDDSSYASTLRRLRHVSTNESRTVAIREGLALGDELRKRIEESRFDSYIIALILALVKDTLDLASTAIYLIPVIGPVINTVLTPVLNLFITTALLFIIMFQGIWFKRLVIKKIWGRLLIPLFAESIPLISFFPWYTISVILVKQKADQTVRDLEERLSSVERDTESLGR